MVGILKKKNAIKTNNVLEQIRDIQKKNSKLIRKVVGKLSLKYEVEFFLKTFSTFVNEKVEVVTSKVTRTPMISIKNTNVRRLFDVYNSQIQNKNWYTVKR